MVKFECYAVISFKFRLLLVVRITCKLVEWSFRPLRSILTTDWESLALNPYDSKVADLWGTSVASFFELREKKWKKRTTTRPARLRRR